MSAPAGNYIGSGMANIVFTAMRAMCLERASVSRTNGNLGRLPTGALTIQIGRWPSRNWKDTPKTQLEKRLGEVVGGIVALAQETHAKEVERRDAKKRTDALWSAMSF